MKFVLVVFLCLHINGIFGYHATITAESLVKLQNQTNLPKRIRSYIVDCLSSPDLTKCLKKQLIDVLELAIKDNTTWQFSDYIKMEKKNNQDPSLLTTSTNLNDKIKNRLTNLIESRSITFTPAPVEFAEGRKKKDKEKAGIAMIGGMAMMAMMAQMFLGKILMLAGAAFLMSKVALFFSVLTSLKKVHGHNDHVIYTDGSGGGGGGHSSWHRQYAADDTGSGQKRQNYI